MPCPPVLSSSLLFAHCEDFFRGQVVNEVALAGLDHCMVCTAAAGKVYLRHYHIGFQRSGSKVSLMVPISMCNIVYARCTLLLSIDRERNVATRCFSSYKYLPCLLGWWLIFLCLFCVWCELVWPCGGAARSLTLD